MAVHSHSTPPERNPFDPESESLFLALFFRQGDPTAGSNDAVPRKPLALLERPHREASGPRESRRGRHLAVGDHFSRGHRGDYLS
jgi:hypothetical protein